jgi:beta-xylosidase
MNNNSISIDFYVVSLKIVSQKPPVFLLPPTSFLPRKDFLFLNKKENFVNETLTQITLCILPIWGIFQVAGCGDSPSDKPSTDQSLENTQTLCTDKEDNDGDGATDCADAECKPFCGPPSLPEETIQGGLVVDDSGLVVTDGDETADGFGDTESSTPIPPGGFTNTYINPVLPGDHPDMNLFKEGDGFYITGSSFAISPNVEILHSKDLVHWERVSRAVRADWEGLQKVNEYGGGTWGGFIRKLDDTYFVYFAVNFSQYFATAKSLKGPWEDPVRVEGNTGYDDSVFVDDDGKAYMLIKHDHCGSGVNRIHEIGPDGQLTGDPIDLKFINDELCDLSSDYWAEGPTMAKRNGYYYYFASTHTGCGGTQYAWRSKVLSGNQEDWESLGMVLKGDAPFSGSQHSSAPLELDDGTWWAVYHSYDCSTRRGLGRQGLLGQVTWDENDVPVFDPAPLVAAAPDLKSGGIPRLRPVNDDFESGALGPHWTFYGYTEQERYSATRRPGWLEVNPDGDTPMYVVQKSVPHDSAMVALMDFKPAEEGEEAGIRIGNAINSLEVRVSRVWDQSDKLRFSFDGDMADVAAPKESEVWLKLDHREHSATAWYSVDRMEWTQIGAETDIKSLDNFDALANGWVGNQAGLFAVGKSAYFDRFSYRDGFSKIPADEPDEQSGTESLEGGILGGLENGDFVLFGSVDLGGAESNGIGIMTSAVELRVSSEVEGAILEVWLDPFANGKLAATCEIPNTGGFDTFKTVTCELLAIGSHEVVLKTKGKDGELVRIESFRFIPSKYSVK